MKIAFFRIEENDEERFIEAGAVKVVLFLLKQKTEGNVDELSENTKVVYVLPFRYLRIDVRCEYYDFKINELKPNIDPRLGG